ncbi:MAG TPA: hypothetical protein PLR50_13135, partial [Candidatus Rifleibacterium sp.]|nr:hypothetical protein [Candidatus Rifleibacterium sp.]
HPDITIRLPKDLNAAVEELILSAFESIPSIVWGNTESSRINTLDVDKFNLAKFEGKFLKEPVELKNPEGPKSIESYRLSAEDIKTKKPVSVFIFYVFVFTGTLPW